MAELKFVGAVGWESEDLVLAPDLSLSFQVTLASPFSLSEL